MPVDSLTRRAELITAQVGISAQSAPTNGHVPGVYACIVKVSAEIAKEGISKTRTNKQQDYKFRGIDDVLNVLAPMLVRAGLVILPRCLSRNVAERQAKSGGTLFYVTIEAEFDFVCAADGSTHTVRMFGEAMDSADKATNKAMSAAYKYAAFQAFCIPTEGEDTDETTHELAAPAPPRPVVVPVREERENTAEPPVGDRGSRPDGSVLIVNVDSTPTKNPAVTKYLLTTSTGETYSTIKDKLASLATRYKREATPVFVTGEQSRWGLELLTLTGVDDPPF